MRILDSVFQMATLAALLFLVVLATMGVLLLCLTVSWLWVVVVGLIVIALGGLVWNEHLTRGED